MKHLLDTYTILFANGGHKRLSKVARLAFHESASSLWISVVSLWRIAVRIGIGTLDLPIDSSLYHRHLGKLKANVWAVEARQSVESFRLPLLHKGPFDRLLIDRRGLMSLRSRPAMKRFRNMTYRYTGDEW